MTVVLRPNKHSHPDQTVINISAVLLKKLRKKRLVEFDELRQLAAKTAVGGDALFLPSVNFLYLMGVVEYRQKTDSFEYVGR